MEQPKKENSKFNRPDTPLAKTPDPTYELYTKKADSLDFEARKKVYSEVNKITNHKNQSSINLDQKKKDMKRFNKLVVKKLEKSPDMIQSKIYRDLASKTRR
jgi:uncharacterized protein Yka (UPF0111/DUF47 family)